MTPGGHDDDLGERLARVRLVALDVDGVLTDGRVVYSGEEEIQAFDVQDGLGVVELGRAGITVAWITGRGSRATERRAAELAVEELWVRSGPKRERLMEIQRRRGIGAEETLAMGDDLPDLALAEVAAVFFAPANARAEVKARADVVTASHGGRGAVREMAEAVLRARDAWGGVVDRAAR